MIINSYSGAGGWEQGLKALGGSDCIGVDNDPDMVATAHAAGHRSELADVSAIDPRELLNGERCEGVIAGPPCPSFSNAGKRLGKLDLPAIHRLIAELADGIDNRTTTPMHDERSRLTVEPMRWVKLLDPDWIALEQVPMVLPVWQDMAVVLRAHGYNVWTGIAFSERYSVPQTRQRAILLAHKYRSVTEPDATHRRWYPDRHKFSTNPPDAHLPRWISMVEALGDTELPSWCRYRPATTVSGDPRISGPGHKDGRPGSDYPRQQDNAIRVSIEDAATLQTFPRDYPWQGTKSKQYLMCGNAIPPLLAKACLAELIGECQYNACINLAALGI